jgi:acetyl esterase/lipase
MTGDLLACGLPQWMRHCWCHALATWWRGASTCSKYKNNNPIWSAPVKSLSPIDLSGKVPPSVHVQLLVGSKDPVAPPELSQHYAETLRNHGNNAALTLAPGLEHDILLEPVAMNALKGVVETLTQ